MKVTALLEGNQIHWLNVALQIKSPIQVVLEIPDDAILPQEILSPSERLFNILGENFKSNTASKHDYYHHLEEKYR